MEEEGDTSFCTDSECRDQPSSIESTGGGKSPGLFRRRLMKACKNRSLFPNDEAVFKLMYLALRNISKRWTMPIPNWSAALNQFAILFDDRVPVGGLNQTSVTQTA
jgi:hypothetical protein